MSGREIAIEKLNNHYQKIWDEFLKHQDDFKVMHGFGREEIKRIGMKKFINAEGWKDENDVVKFNTDALHIGICPSCNNEFGVSESNFCLCTKCKPSFDLKEMINLSSVVGERAASSFLKSKNTSDEIKALIREKAILLSEFVFTMMVRGGNEKSELFDPDYTLILEAVFKKNKNVFANIEKRDKINDILDGAKKLVENRLDSMFVFSENENRTEV